jgi:uncharacterized protein YbaR (Trm112 family)
VTAWAGLLACPRCADRPALVDHADGLLCPECGAVYPVREGVPDLMPESAVLPEAPDAR